MKDRVASMRTYLNIAKSEWGMRLDDDSHVDAACYCLMFSIETGLKYLTSLSGLKPPYKHEMKVLLQSLPEQYYNSKWYKLLSKWRDETNEWYKESRYGDNFSVLSNAMCDYFIAAELLLHDADMQVSYVCTVENKVQRVLNKLNSDRPVSDIIRYLPDADLPEEVLYGLVIDILQSK